GFLRERRWGFSTQTGRGWFADRTKGLAIGVVLMAAAWTSAVALARALPSYWPLATAAALALAVPVLSVVAPPVVEPLFNRRRPLLARADGRRRGVPARARRAGAAEPIRPRATSPRLPPPVHAPDAARAARARRRVGARPPARHLGCTRCTSTDRSAPPTVA